MTSSIHTRLAKCIDVFNTKPKGEREDKRHCEPKWQERIGYITSKMNNIGLPDF